VKRVFAIALFAAFVLAGCGGSGRLTHAEFVKRADALCGKSVAKLRVLKNPSSIPELVVYLKKAKPIRRSWRCAVAWWASVPPARMMGRPRAISQPTHALTGPSIPML